MSIPRLTAVICFANEGEEVENTCRGIRETCGDEVDILLINDASTDGVDYESVADRYTCRYLVNDEQIGPAHARHKGASWARTDNIIFLDSHMRFYKEGWHRIINEIVDDDPDALYCTRSRPLKRGGVYDGGVVGHGASMTMETDSFLSSLQPKWNIKPLAETGASYIPCILGGNYASRRDYFLGIGGYRGLHRYGGEEALVSIKSWLAGGGCKLIEDVEIGHIYRDEKGAPWNDNIKYYHFNKLSTAYTLFDTPLFERYKALLQREGTAEAAMKVYESRKNFVERARFLFESIRKHDIAYFREINDAFIRGERITPERLTS
ncbi:glycosyltransferase [Kordiimonas gwangyangensis]|uniref:glycosyltransferase n=1 Tax=Kordiimonas gwangyangensis TaxID=288022 RepID=UPI0003709166|nr:glycosyltransferase [Kordiimonas gwangyangensis]